MSNHTFGSPKRQQAAKFKPSVICDPGGITGVHVSYDPPGLWTHFERVCCFKPMSVEGAEEIVFLVAPAIIEAQGGAE
jgi:hypothetical protein